MTNASGKMTDINDLDTGGFFRVMGIEADWKCVKRKREVQR